MLNTLKVMRGVGLVFMIVTYAVMVHHVNASGQASRLGALLALAPLLLITVTFAAKFRSNRLTSNRFGSNRLVSKLLGISLIVLFLFGSWLTLPLIEQHTALIFWLQDVGLMLLLLVTFARTLLPGRKPLCVHFAEIINGGTLPLDHERYAYKVTIAWVLFFAAIILTSTVLFYFAPLATWSLFVNFLTLPLVALMFIVEFLVRRQVLTNLPDTNALDAVRAYLNSKRAH